MSQAERIELIFYEHNHEMGKMTGKKRNPRPRVLGWVERKGVIAMTPDKLIKAMKRIESEWRVPLSSEGKTRDSMVKQFNRWAKQGLMPQGVTKSLGRGEGGKETTFPDDAVFQLEASFYLAREGPQCKRSEVVEARQIALEEKKENPFRWIDDILALGDERKYKLAASWAVVYCQLMGKLKPAAVVRYEEGVHVGKSFKLLDGTFPELADVWKQKPGRLFHSLEAAEIITECAEIFDRFDMGISIGSFEWVDPALTESLKKDKEKRKK